MRFWTILGALAGLLVVSAAQAQTPAPAPTYPFFAIQRLSVAAGLDHSWYAKDTLTPVDHEWKYGGFAAYRLVPNLSLTGSLTYGQNTREVEERLGLRLVIWNGANQ